MSEDIQGKIRSWLTEEGLVVSKIQNDKVDFQLNVADPSLIQQFMVHIVKTKGRGDMGVYVLLQNPPAVRELLKSMDEREKVRTLEGWKREILKMGLHYAVIPGYAKPDEISILDQVYIEDMNRTILRKSITMVTNAALLIMSLMAQKFEPDASK